MLRRPLPNQTQWLAFRTFLVLRIKQEEDEEVRLMEFWNKARSFAQETAKRTQDLTKEAAKRSPGLSVGAAKFSNVVAEATKRSKEIAAEASKQISAEASKRADQLRIEAIKRADDIKNFADGINVPGRIAILEPYVDSGVQKKDLETFGITDELREFVQGITLTTFQDFPLEDEIQLSDDTTVSNVRQDLNEWQERHANLVLSAVKEISKLRYELCPRVMKERKFWKIYFTLVNSHTAPYEMRYMEEAKLKSSEPVKDHKAMESPNVGSTSNQELQQGKQDKKTSTVTDQDLDVFLLGDTGDSDNETDDDTGDIDEDFDKVVESVNDKKGKT